MRLQTIKRNDLDVSLIAPGRGSKYSPNLYRWLTGPRMKDRIWAQRVYQGKDGILWIGMQDDRELIGSKLMAVLCNGASECTAAWQGVDAVEIEDFWVRYVADGRCAIDVAHAGWFVGDVQRWNNSSDGSSRSCNWCGKVTQTLKRWTEVVELEDWQTTSVTAAAA